MPSSPVQRAGRLGLLLLLLVGGCRRDGEPTDPPGGKAEGAAWFRDVTGEVGLDFVHDAGPEGTYFMPQIGGSGAALFDFDNDGRLDVYLLQFGGPDSGARNRLYRQGEDGRFTDVSKGSGLDIAGYCTGVAVGDVNNDGWPDVLVTQYGGLKLFLNNGNGTFTDVTEQAGLGSLLWGASASFVDYDRDGRLDLVVVNYLAASGAVSCSDPRGRRDFCAPRQYPGTVTHLYRNLGRLGAAPVRFEDVTEKAGLGKTPGPGLGVVCADFDGDGWPDIFVTNDGQPNRLWINQRDGTFKDEAVSRGLAYNALGVAQANMGIALGDVDGDGLFDLYVTHLGEEGNVLWSQRPRGTFHDRTAAAGLGGPEARTTGFGAVLGDFDQDGAVDLAFVSGRVSRSRPVDEPRLSSFWREYAEPNRLFVNDGAGHFRDVSPSNPDFCGHPGVYRSLACGVLNEHGSLDLLVTEVAGPVRLFRNVAPNRGHWLLVRAVDPALGGRDAYGAEVTVRAGSRRWKRWLNPGSSYQCSNDPRAHFGLGQAGSVDEVRVLWPDGTEETFPGGPADCLRVLRQGEGRREHQP